MVLEPMRRLLPLLLLAGCALQAQPRDEHEEIARRVLSTTPLIDGHNDLVWAIRTADEAPGDVARYGLRGGSPGHTDIPRLRAGMVGGQFWSVYVPATVADPYRAQLDQIDLARRVFAEHPEVFQETRTAAEVMPAFRDGKIASILGMEGGYPLESSVDRLAEFYDLGVRYLTLTHSANTSWADAAGDAPEHGGLTELGREMIREMNRLGMLVDLSHVSAETMLDALDVSTAPVIFSHSSARTVTNVARNVPDEILRRMPENGGVVMVTFVPTFVSTDVARWSATSPAARGPGPAPRATIDDVIRHIEHVREIAGIDHVGIGADYDGISSLPVGLEDVSTYPRLFAQLSRRGWSEDDLRKLAGENILRAWAEAEEVAAGSRGAAAPRRVAETSGGGPPSSSALRVHPLTDAKAGLFYQPT